MHVGLGADIEQIPRGGDAPGQIVAGGAHRRELGGKGLARGLLGLELLAQRPLGLGAL
ncbi:MAG: hypothetical protein H0U12_00580 [Thermoleophilaceae bacterium]|nr:hypothetical protein [Thermoleophilaceae bacterium]